MLVLFWAVLSWLLRYVVLKFVILGVLLALITVVTPWIGEMVSSYISTSSLTSLFSTVPAGGWYFLDLFRLDVGMPLCISAWVTRFLIRRIPFFG